MLKFARVAFCKDTLSGCLEFHLSVCLLVTLLLFELLSTKWDMNDWMKWMDEGQWMDGMKRVMIGLAGDMVLLLVSWTIILHMLFGCLGFYILQQRMLAFVALWPWTGLHCLNFMYL